MRGFTLVETLVAITIIALAITGPFYAVQQALNASRASRDNLIASSLAQEGLEYVRSIRDGNYLGGVAWLSGLASCYAVPCTIDPTQNQIRTSVAPLYLSSQGLYNQASSGTVTPFTRTMQLTTVSANEVRVTIIMTWQTRGVPHTMTLSESLHNWL